MQTSQAIATISMTIGLCQGPALPDVSQCDAGHAVVQCTYEQALVYPECPHEDPSSPWFGECVWSPSGGLFGREGWTYPACPANEVCVPPADLPALRLALQDGDFSAWCYAGQGTPEPTWIHVPGAPGPQPCVTQSVTWAPQDSEGGLAL